MMPLESACTVWTEPPTCTSTVAFSTGTLMKLRQPRRPVGSLAGREGSLVSRTRPRTRIQSVDP